MKEPALAERDKKRNKYGGKSAAEVMAILADATRQHACDLKPAGMLVFRGPSGWVIYFLGSDDWMPAQYCPGCGIELRRVTK